jgi:hypothetical protein
MPPPPDLDTLSSGELKALVLSLLARVSDLERTVIAQRDEVGRLKGLADWIGAHVNALAFLGGVPKLLVGDNLRAGVTAVCRCEPGINRAYQEMAPHYGTAVLPTLVRQPRDKAKEVVAVLIVERYILARLRHRRFLSLGEPNEAIREVLGHRNARLMRKLGASRGTFFETIDRPALLALPAEPYAYVDDGPGRDQSENLSALDRNQRPASTGIAVHGNRGQLSHCRVSLDRSASDNPARSSACSKAQGFKIGPIEK